MCRTPFCAKYRQLALIDPATVFSFKAAAASIKCMCAVISHILPQAYSNIQHKMSVFGSDRVSVSVHGRLHMDMASRFARACVYMVKGR